MTLEKVAQYHHIKVNGMWVADKVTMESMQAKHKTTLKMSNFKLNMGLSNDAFTVEKLANGKG